MKFKLDENIPFSLKKLIEATGDHQVDSVFHEKKTGIDDHSLLKLCLQEQRILISLDADFNNPIMHPQETLFGIIILRPTSQGKQAVSDLFTNLLASFKLDDVVNKVLIVEYNNITIRWDCV
ncbi:MAG: DUF5615 family PIN-like protein [Candidatus Heimdallarchaeota archaeon]